MFFNTKQVKRKNKAKTISHNPYFNGICFSTLNNAPIRDKAIINFATMTGQGRQEIANLTIQQIIDAWNTKLDEKIFTLNDVFKS